MRRPPRIAVCGVNPHAGEGGLLGREEVVVIGPAIRRARAAGVRCEGPFAADGLFSLSREMPYDEVKDLLKEQLSRNQLEKATQAYVQELRQAAVVDVKI